MEGRLTRTERRILLAICANGGEYQSLFRLATELEVRYETAWQNTLRLCARGLIYAELSTHHGRRYILHIPCGLPGIACPCNSIQTRKSNLPRVPVFEKSGSWVMGREVRQ